MLTSELRYFLIYYLGTNYIYCKCTISELYHRAVKK